MSETITLEQLQTAQNNFINQRTAEINQLKQDTATALQNLSALGQRVYGYNHTSFAVKDINTVYDEIIEANPALASKSAIGFTALLNSGETVSKQGNRMFIYGKAPETEGADVEIEEEFEDYTYSDAENLNGTEFVIVWLFADNGALNFASCPRNTFVLKIINKNDIATINLDTTKLDFLRTLITDGYDVITNPYVDTFIVETDIYAYESPSNKPSTNLKHFICTCEELSNYATSSNYNRLESIDFPNLRIINIDSTAGNAKYNAFSNTAKATFPKLERIDYLKGILFQNMSFVELPETLINVNLSGATKQIFDTVKGKVTLNCRNLPALHDNWYAGTAPAELEIADDWGCSVNLAVVAPTAPSSKWVDKTTWVDLFENYLRDMTLTDATRTLKIPTAIYNALTTEEIAIATAKGWTITHP